MTDQRIEDGRVISRAEMTKLLTAAQERAFAEAASRSAWTAHAWAAMAHGYCDTEE